MQSPRNLVARYSPTGCAGCLYYRDSFLHQRLERLLVRLDDDIRLKRADRHSRYPALQWRTFDCLWRGERGCDHCDSATGDYGTVPATPYCLWPHGWRSERLIL